MCSELCEGCCSVFWSELTVQAQAGVSVVVLTRQTVLHEKFLPPLFAEPQTAKSDICEMNILEQNKTWLLPNPPAVWWVRARAAFTWSVMGLWNWPYPSWCVNSAGVHGRGDQRTWNWFGELKESCKPLSTFPPSFWFLKCLSWRGMGLLGSTETSFMGGAVFPSWKSRGFGGRKGDESKKTAIKKSYWEQRRKLLITSSGILQSGHERRG